MIKFNRGKFNVKAYKSNTVTASTGMVYESELTGYLLERYTDPVTATVIYGTALKGIVGKNAVPFPLDMEFTSYALASNLIYSEPGSSDVLYTADAIGAMLGEEYLEINNIKLPPGAEIEIDMCELTVTVNGENAMDFLSDECDFFHLLPGVNEVNIVARGSNSMEIRTYWKDRWL